MLRYPPRTLVNTHVVRRTVHPALLTSSRAFTDKVLIGATASFLTCSTTLSLFHLLVTPVAPTIALASVAAATASGATCVIDGGSQGGTSFGAAMGIIVAVMGGYYAKSQKEPWRK